MKKICLIQSEYFLMVKLSGDPYNEVQNHLSSQIRLYDCYIDLIYFIECYSRK
jgi:hypothetical protein